MSDQGYSPEEFARLMALPDGHPDRRRAESSPMFQAWMRMHDTFTAPGEAPAEAAFAEADAALAARLETAIGVPAHAGAHAPSGGAPAARREIRIEPPRRGFFDTLTGWLAAPALRPALAVLVIAGAGTVWWTMSHNPSPRVVRGVTAPTGTPVLAEPKRADGGVEFSWTPTPGADGYRLVFIAPDLSELAQLEAPASARLTVAMDALPPSAISGGKVQVEVVALRQGDPIARSGTKSLQLPQ